MLGDRRDEPRLLERLGDAPSAGAALAALGALGDPAAVPTLIQAMSVTSTELAAGAAFVRLTGATGIESDQRMPPPDDLPEDERDFWEGPYAPNVARATAWWAANRSRFTATARWQGGLDVTAAIKQREVLDGLPLEVRRDVYLAARAQDPRAFPDLELEARTPAFEGGFEFTSRVGA